MPGIVVSSGSNNPMLTSKLRRGAFPPDKRDWHRGAGGISARGRCRTLRYINCSRRAGLVCDYFCEIGTSEAPLAFSSAAFSVARAPAMILMMSLLLSLQSYSKIGPLIALKGTMAVHGFVQVEGSLTVKLYSISSAATRVNRSVIFKV